MTLQLGGCELQSQEKMGKPAGVILEKDIPAFLGELGQTVAATGEPYSQWVISHEEELEKIAGTYLAV